MHSVDLSHEREGELQWFRQALTASELNALRLTYSELAPSTRELPDVDLPKLIEKMIFFKSLRATNPSLRIVRLVMFNKRLTHNWALPWHQDRVVHVNERKDVPDFSNWTQKSGQWHCEAPETVLQKMSFLHIYLDSVTAERGPMEVALNSHHHGVVRDTEIDTIISQHNHELCCAEAGDVLRIPMLTVHRSRAALKPSARRIIRIDLAEADLPRPLLWDL